MHSRQVAYRVRYDAHVYEAIEHALRTEPMHTVLSVHKGVVKLISAEFPAGQQGEGLGTMDIVDVTVTFGVETYVDACANRAI